MPVPEFAEFMLPLLKLAGDEKTHTLAEARETLGTTMNISPEDRVELLPSGTQSRYDNRVTWARTYLTKAGLLERIGRGAFRITQRGQEVLKNPPARIDKKFLRRFEEFRGFTDGWKSQKPDSSEAADTDDEDRTPQELLEASYESLRGASQPIYSNACTNAPPLFSSGSSWIFSLRWATAAAVPMPAKPSAKAAMRASTALSKKTSSGSNVVYIQAKRWTNPVSRPMVQGFAGSLEGQRARKGVMITTSQFTADAREFVRHIEKKIVLIDGSQLAQLMIDHGIGVANVATYVVSRVDTDYFEEDEYAHIPILPSPSRSRVSPARRKAPIPAAPLHGFVSLAPGRFRGAANSRPRAASHDGAGTLRLGAAHSGQERIRVWGGALGVGVEVARGRRGGGLATAPATRRSAILTQWSLHGVGTGRVRCGSELLHKRMSICRGGSAKPFGRGFGRMGSAYTNPIRSPALERLSRGDISQSPSSAGVWLAGFSSSPLGH